MKILLLSDVYFPRINGVSTSIQTLRRQLVDLGHEVYLLAPQYHAPSDDESWIVRVPAHSLFFDPEDRLMRYGRAFSQAIAAVPGDIDIIHVHTPFVAHYLGRRLAQWLQVPCVETYHTFFEDYLQHYLPILPKPVLRWCARQLSRSQCNAVDGVISPSQPMLDVLAGYGVTRPAAVIPTGLESHSYARGDGAAFRRRHGIPARREMLLYVGRVAHEKNIGFLLKMLTVLRPMRPDVLLVIAGEGPAREALKLAVEHLGLTGNVLFIGYLDRRTELNDCYRAADVFVFSSLTETQGLVLLEAMAQGVPVVAIAEMGTRSILVAGQGAVIAPHDAGEFAARVRTLLENPGQRTVLGEAAFAWAKRWAAPAMAARVVDFYGEVITAATKPRASSPQVTMP